MTDKKVLYMNDFPKFRYIAGAIVVAYFIFTQLWTYWLNPLSVYVRNIFEPSLYFLFPIIFDVIFYIAFIVLTFIPFDKSWRYMFLLYSTLFISYIISNFLLVYQEYKLFAEFNVEYDVAENIMSILGIVLMYFIVFLIYLIPYFQKKFSKYLAIIAGGILLFITIINLLAVIRECFDIYNSDTYDGYYYYYCGQLMKGEEIDYFLATRVINSIPLLQIYFFFLSLFISVKKREKVSQASAVIYNNPAVGYTSYTSAAYYPQNPQPNYTQPVHNQPVASLVQPSSEPTVSANQNSYVNPFNQPAETTVAVNYTPEEVANIVPLAPSYQGSANKVNKQVNVPVTPQINQISQPQVQSQPMFCNQCGYKMPNDFAFCPKCGKKFK